MVKRTCDRCGMAMSPESAILNVRDKTFYISLYERNIGGLSITEVDLCDLCQDDMYEFIFHKKRDSKDGDE